MENFTLAEKLTVAATLGLMFLVACGVTAAVVHFWR